VLLHSESAGYVIDLQWIGPDTALPRVDRLRTLATDPRLEALSGSVGPTRPAALGQWTS
jgi:hypothetical protein